MKKTNLLLGVFASLSIIAGATSCSSKGNFTSKEKQNVEVLTGIKLLESSFGGTNAIKKAAVLGDTGVEEEIAQLLPSVDALLTNGTAISSKVEEVDTTVNEITYKFKETLNYKDSELKDASYTLFYNKTSISDKDSSEDKNEVETNEKLEGVVLMGENEYYPFKAISEHEQENDEVEFERSFVITIDETSYIKVEEENEKEGNETETEFSYLLVKNGKKELEYSISIENEGNNFNEVEYELNGIEYEVSKTKRDGTDVYKVEREGKHDQETTYYFKKTILEDGTIKFDRI